MKRFQRLNAFILTMALFLSLLPAGVLQIKTSAAEQTPDPDLGKTFLHASYIAGGAKVDGTKDAGYRFDVPVGDLRLGAAWNKDSLWLSFNSADPKIETLELNGVAVDLSGAVSDSCTEIKVALPADLTAANTLTVQLEGSDEVPLQLAFDTQPAKTNFSLGSANFGAYWPLPEAETDQKKKDKTVVELDTYNNETHGNHTENRKHEDLVGFSNATVFASSLTADTVFEMDLAVEFLPDVTTLPTAQNRSALKGGLNISILDDESLNKVGNYIAEALYTGIYRQGDTLYVMYWNGTGYESKLAGTYADGSNYHLRIEYSYRDNSAQDSNTNIADNDLISVKYFVNGKLVATSDNAKVRGSSYGASSGNQVLIYATDIKTTHANAVANNGATRTDVTLSNCTVTKTQPAIEVVKEIASLGKVAELDANAVTELRKAYEALTNDEKEAVANIDSLSGAEKYLAQIPYAHATFTTAPITLDGKPNEAAYHKQIAITDTVKLTTAWNGENLYLGFMGTETAVTELTLGTAVTNYESKTATGGVEYKIPLDLPNYAEPCDFSFKLDGKTWAGKLVFDTVTYDGTKPTTSLAYGAEPFNVELDSAGTSVKKFKDDWYVLLDSFNSSSTLSKYAESDRKHQDLFYPSMKKLEASLEKDTVVELDVTVNYLPDGARIATAATNNNRSSLYGGLNITVMDGEDKRVAANGFVQEAMWSGMYQENGKLYFVYWDNNAYVSVLVDDYIPGKTYSLRIEYAYAENSEASTETNDASNDKVSARYYINGKLIATASQAKAITTDTYSARPGTVIQLLTCDVTCNNGRSTQETRASVSVSKLEVSKTNPSVYEGLVDVEDVERFIREIGADITLASETAINKARDAYDALDPLVRHLVSNLEDLEAAEQQLNVLKNSYFHASVSVSKITVDGKVSEAAYKRILPLSATQYVSAAWDVANLYLAFAGTATPNVTSLVINGYNVDLSDLKTGNGTAELAVGLNSIGMGAYTGEYAISMRVDGKTWAGKLVLDTAEHIRLKNASIYWGASRYDSGFGLKLDSRAPDSKGVNTYRSGGLFSNCANLYADVNTPTVVEFDFEPTYLPENSTAASAPSRTFLQGGVGVVLRDDRDPRPATNDYGEQGFAFGFGKVDGQLRLYYWYYDAAENINVCETVALADDGKYHVRVEYIYGSGDSVTAKYYINGVMILEVEESMVRSIEDKQEFDFSTAQTKMLMFYASVRSGTENDTNRVEANISNVSVSHINPDLIQELTADIAQVEDLIAAIGPVTMDRAGYIESTQARYELLSETAQKLVSNADVLKAAVAQLKELENSFLHAAFAATPVVVDGVADEEFFRRKLYIGSATFGAAWDVEYLYLYFKDTVTPELATLNINGVAVNATGVTGTGVREIRVKLADLGITNLMQEYPVSIVVGQSAWSGKLILDTAGFEALPYTALYYGATGASDRLSLVINSRNPDTNGENTYRSLASVNTAKLGYQAGLPTVVEMTIDPVFLPEDCTVSSTNKTRTFLTGGLGIAIRDDLDLRESGYGSEGFLFGFGKVDGELKLIYWHVNASNEAEVVVADIPQTNGEFFLRVEFTYSADGEAAAAKFYINGILTTEVDNARIVDGNFSTGQGNMIQMYGGVASGKQSDTNRVEVVLSNISVSHITTNLVDELTNDVPAVEALIDAIGEVTLDSVSKVEAAAAAYEALSELARSQVSNVDALYKAQDRLLILEKSYLHAAFTYDELSLDGRIYEAVYPMNVHVTENVKLGAAWTKKYLYLALEGEAAPAVTELKINGKNVSITSSNSKSGNMGREIRVSLSSLGITGYDKTYPISMKVNGTYWCGTLVQDSNDYEGLPVGSLYYGAAVSSDRKILTLNTLTPDSSGGNTTRSLALVSSIKMRSEENKISILDMDFVVNNMPNNSNAAATPGRDFLNGGVTFTYRDDLSPATGDDYATEAFNFGLGKVDGKLKLFYWYNNAQGKATLATVDIPEASEYRLRVEFANGNGKETAAKYFVNGILLAEADSVRVTAGSYGTKMENGMQIYARTSGAAEANRVDLVLSNISSSHPQLLIIDDASAAMNVDNLIDDIGTVTWESGEQINIARDAYNALTSAQKKLVKKLNVLEAAEAELRKIKDERNAQYGNYVFANYTASEMIIDGKLSEAIWRTPQTIYGMGKLALAWDFNYLYLGVTGSKASTLANLKVNGKSITNLGKLGNDGREMKILLADLGIREILPNQSYPLSFTLDGRAWSGELILDTSTFKALKPSSAFWGGVRNAYKGEFDTKLSANNNRVGAIWETDNLSSLNGSSTVLEMDIKVNAMPNNHKDPTLGRQFAVGGISVTVRDDDPNVGTNGYGTEAFMFGLVREKGQMMFMYWEDSLETYLYEPVEDFGTGVYHLRVEYFYYTNNEVSAKYFVNGMLVAESEDAKKVGESGLFATTNFNLIQVLAYGTDEGAVDADVYNLSVSRTKEMESPEPLDSLTKEEIFGRLDLNHVQNDLNLPSEFVNLQGDRFELIWVSSDTSVITNEGEVIRPLEDAASVTLSLYIKGGDSEIPFWTVNIVVDPLSLEEAESPEKMDAAFSKAPIEIDGILDEEGWRMNGRVLDANKQLFAEYGYQWTQSHLYLAVDYMQGMDTLSLKLNGRYFTLKDGKLIRNGQNVGGSTLAVINGNILEMRIPMSVLGLPSKVSNYGYVIPMSIKTGPYVSNGKTLNLSGIDWFVTENRDHAAVGAGIKNNDAYHGVQKLANGYRLYDLYGGSNLAQIRSYVSFMSTDEYIENFADRKYDTRIEFDFKADAMPVLPTDGSAYTTTGGAYGVSGFTCAAGEITGADGGSLSFNYGIMNTHEGLIFVLNVGGNVKTHTLNKEVGDKFSLAVEWTNRDTLKLFVDGEHLNTFPCVGFWSTGAANASLVVNMRALFAPKSTADNYDVSITNIAFGKVHHEEGILGQVTFDTIRGKNSLEKKITSNLTLPTTITNGQLDKAYSITWSSNKPEYISNEGKVTRPEKGMENVILTATLSTGETKTFELSVHGKKVENDSVLVVEADTSPESGVGVAYKAVDFCLDENNNSIIKIMDGKEKINYVVLKDGDDKADLTPESSTLWVSDDNMTYTRIKDFKMVQIGEKWYLYDFEAEGQYVKFHYTKPDQDEGTFYGTFGDMINAGYDAVFGYNGAAYTESKYTLTNNTGSDKLDHAWTISKQALGITGNDASIRIYADGKLQYHYVSGANVVVRINDLAKGASVELTVLQSNASDIMDISNKEGVHEVIYGVQNTVLSTLRWYYLTLPAGTTFPDGSKLDVETIFAMSGGRYQFSEDGGKTWIAGTVRANAPEGKTPVSGFSEGGWIYDSHTGRMMFEAYRRGSADPSEGAFNKNNIEDSHMHTVIIVSDDGGKTWYETDVLPCRTCMDEYKGNNNIPTYALSYSDGTQLSSYDGKGPNVDFVFPLGTQYDNIGTFACRVAYTTDAGDTWQYSETAITYPSLYGSEGGCSEAWIIEREDGVLTLHVRAQDMGAYHFKVSYSYDKGLTWTNDHIFTDYYAVNGQAFIRKMEIAGENTVISAWGGNTSLGSATYHRNPFVFASSSNDGETFRNIQNIYFRSFEEKYENVYITDTTNVSLVSHSGDDLLFTYRRNRKGDWVITNVEDFDAWFTRTKGAYDGFEKGTLKGDGWNRVVGDVSISSEFARDKYSMKLGTNSMAIRSIPYLQDGTLSFELYVTAGTNFTVELQSGHTRYYDQVSVPIAFRVEDGKLYFNSSTTPAVEGIQEGWNTLSFDLGLSKDEATLSINNGAAVEIPLKMDFDDYVNFINIATTNAGSLYLDEFLVISETVVDMSTDEADQKLADDVVALIKAIKNADDTAGIKAARTAFDKLTQAQQDLVDMRVLANNGKSGLDSMINYYELLRMYEDGDLIVENMIDDIGKVDHNSGDKLVNAEEAYRSLTSAQKRKVDNYATLRLARLRYNRIMEHKEVADRNAAEEVQELIDSILLTNPMRYESKIKAARSAYNNLTADQMALVNNVKLNEAERKLEEQKEEFTRKTLSSMQNLINTLDNVDLTDLALVEGIRIKFNSLTSEQKQVLDDRKLVAAEQTLGTLKIGVDRAILKQYRLEGVIAMIQSIGQVTPEKKALIDAAQASFNKLDRAQQELVWNANELSRAVSIVQTQLQLADIVPNTGETATFSVKQLVPVMLFGTLALAAVVLFLKKRYHA